jgi:urease accessory protein
VGLIGHLDLVCALDSRGVSVLRHQSFRAPMHLSKPYHDAGALVVNVVNPTAGLLEGDRIACRVEVESGARLLLTTPSASRAHRVNNNGRAELVQQMRVAAGGFLEFWPELFIPQKGTRYSQRTELSVEGDAELFFFESLAPGRVASGEAFAYTELEWATDVHWDATLIARERYRLAPDVECVRALRTAFPDAYYASGFVVSERLEKHEVWQRIHALHSPDAWIGCSRLAGRGWAIKLVAEGSVALRRTLQRIRMELYEAIDRPAPSLRRAGAGW